MPTLIDHYSGEPMKMITDHYRVDDELALELALATQSDVEGDRQEGRVWFEALAGESVTFVKRKVQVTADVMAAARKPAARASSKKGNPLSASAPELDAATMAQLMSEAIHRSYAHWADEPIPALDHKTPRQSIKTSAGLERVKGLLRSYEASEAQQAGQQRRSEVSYDFLWASLGLTR